MTMEELSQRREQQRQIAQAVRAFDVSHTEAGQVLASLSTNTEIEGLEVFEEEIAIDGGVFSGPLLWHVVLRFAGEDPVTAAETFPGSFEGSFEQAGPRILHMTVDTRAASS